MPKGERRRRAGIAAFFGLVALALTTSPLWGSYLGKQLSWLEVRRVEVSGTRLLAPHEVLEVSGIRIGQHLLDEVEAWEEAIRAHPVVADVRITRKPPQTLRIRIEEKRPVAFVNEGTLRFATAGGEILPLDPAAADLDLPLAHGSFADSAGAARLGAMLAETGRLTELDPALMAEVWEIRPGDDEGRAFVLTHRLGDILVPTGMDAARLEQLRAVLDDLDRRFPPAEGAAGMARHRLDLRFDGQIVVRPSRTRELT